jgi:hypothetical protein
MMMMSMKFWNLENIEILALKNYFLTFFDIFTCEGKLWNYAIQGGGLGEPSRYMNI